MQIPKPWSAQIEFVEGCTKICGFCGIQGIRKTPGNFKYMELNTAMKTANEIAEYCPTIRIEFAMHGEPTMHPDLFGLIEAFRGKLPKAQIQITTNGVKFTSGRLEQISRDLFMAGIDFICLDTYEPERSDLRGQAQKAKESGFCNVIDFYESDISPWSNFHRKLNNTIILLDDIGINNKKRSNRVIYNHAGNNISKPIPKESLKKQCTLPFREFSVCWNGDINICCQDWKHENVIGNINSLSLKSIWEGERFELFRYHLYHKNRNLTPCYKCDINCGMRVGLLSKHYREMKI